MWIAYGGLYTSPYPAYAEPFAAAGARPSSAAARFVTCEFHDALNVVVPSTVKFPLGPLAAGS